MQTIANSQARVQGYKSVPVGNKDFDIVDPEPTPAEQVQTLEEALDLPAGETVGLDGRETLKRFFEVIETDLKIHSKRALPILIRRVIGAGHRVGALRGITMEQLAAACGGVTRQSICQAGTKFEGLVGREFAREPQGRKTKCRKAASDE